MRSCCFNGLYHKLCKTFYFAALIKAISGINLKTSRTMFANWYIYDMYIYAFLLYKLQSDINTLNNFYSANSVSVDINSHQTRVQMMHPCCATLVVATEQVATNYTCPNPIVIESGQNNLKHSLFFGKNNFSHTHYKLQLCNRSAEY